MTEHDRWQMLFDRFVAFEAAMKPVPAALERLRHVEIEQAQARGALRVLLWALPGGPALVALIVWLTLR
jgi:hypothetical protein